MEFEEPTREEVIEVNQRLWNTIGMLTKIIELAHPRLIAESNDALQRIAISKVDFPEECGYCGFSEFEWEKSKGRYWLMCNHCKTPVDGPY